MSTLTVPERYRVSTVWRLALASADEHALMMRSHRRALDEGTERPAYLRYAAEQLEEHARLYVAAVRAASRAEESMEALGMVFTRPPWRMP